MASSVSLSAMMIVNILEDLGHEVPNSEEIEALIQSSTDKIKESQGLDVNAVEYKLVPIEKEWVKNFIAE